MLFKSLYSLIHFVLALDTLFITCISGYIFQFGYIDEYDIPLIGYKSYCAPYTRVYGVRARVKWETGWYINENDLNAVRFICGTENHTNTHEIMSAEHDEGIWADAIYCPGTSHAVGADYNQEPNTYSIFHDHSAGSEVALFCSNGQRIQTKGVNVRYAVWKGFKMCLRDMHICGFRTAADKNYGVAKIEFDCCSDDQFEDLQ